MAPVQSGFLYQIESLCEDRIKKWLDNPFYEQKQIIEMAQLKLFDG